MDQRAGAGQWRYLGTWAFDPAGSPLVVLAGGTDGTLSADALRFVGAGPPAAALRFVLGDHLGTPRKLTDNAGTVVWDRLQTPFGLDHAVTGTAATPVRFPGQYADGESGLSYNYYRDYDPSLGRYIQSDPIGLAGGLNTYSYVGGNPLGYVDPYGQNTMAMGRGGGFALIGLAGRALSEAVCQVAAANARDAIKGVGIAALLWILYGPGGILFNEGAPSQTGQDGGEDGTSDSTDSDDQSETSTTGDGKKARDHGKNEPHGDPNAIEKAEKQIEEIREKIKELKQQPGTSREIKILERKIKKIRKIAQKKAKGDSDSQKQKRP